jgi:hypothetical protein
MVFMEECIHGVAARTCSSCHARDLYGASVWVTAGGAAFHRRRNCEYLVAGQELVAQRGGSPDVVRSVSVGVAQAEGRQPCLLCYPRPGTRQQRRRPPTESGGPARVDRTTSAPHSHQTNERRSTSSTSRSVVSSRAVVAALPPEPKRVNSARPSQGLPMARKIRREGLVAQVRAERGVTLTTQEDRFQQGQWTYQGLAPLVCEDCGGRLHVYRRPYQSSGREYRYWGIVCLACCSVSGLDIYDAQTKQAFRSWDTKRQR